MADNIELNAGSGGASLATDQAAGGEHYQYVKVAFGADNTQTKVDGSNPLPVTLSGVATSAKQDTGNTSLAAIDGSLIGISAAIQTHAAPPGSDSVAAVAGWDGTNIRRLKTDAGGEAQVDVLSSALPSGAATESSLSAMAGDLGDSADAEATGNGSLIAILKRVRTLLTKNSRSDTYTGAASGTTVDVSTAGMSRFAVQVKGTGAAPTSWTVHVDVSLDGTNFQSLYTHTNTDPGDGGVKWGPAGDYPALYFRTRCSALVLGSATNIVVTVVAMP